MNAVENNSTLEDAAYEEEFGSARPKPLPWTLLERYVEHYPDDCVLIFGRAGKLVEIHVDHEAWSLFDA